MHVGDVSVEEQGCDIDAHYLVVNREEVDIHKVREGPYLVIRDHSGEVLILHVFY